MAAVVDIWNRALQRLGAARLQSVNDSSVNARACRTCYDTLRQSVLRSHPWNFAIQRFSIAASLTPPAFGYKNAYPLPAGWLRVLPPDPIQNYNNRDWIVEGGSIITDYTPPLNVRCVVDITDTTVMDASFIEALSAKMAFEMCEALTQSNTKKKDCVEAYKDAISEARKNNAIEKVPQQAQEDTWVTARINGTGNAGPGWGWGAN